MCGHLKPKRLEFEIDMGQITNQRIQPLLSLRVERPENMILDKMKYEFSKQFCPPSKIDFGSDEKWAIEHDSDFTAPQRTNETECPNKCVLQVFFFEYFDYINFFLFNFSYYLIAETRRFANHHKRDESNTLPSIDKTLTALSIGPITKIKN